MRTAYLGLALSAAFVAACGSVAELASALPTTGTNAATTTPVQTLSDSPPPERRFFNTCELMPVSDVASGSPLRSPLVHSERNDPSVEEQCGYYSSIDPPVPWPDSVSLTLRDLVTSADAAAELAEFHDFGQENYPPVTEVRGLGDAAYTYAESQYQVLVNAVQGRYWAHVIVVDSGNLEFPEVPNPQKVSYGVNILRLALTRMQLP